MESAEKRFLLQLTAGDYVATINESRLLCSKSGQITKSNGFQNRADLLSDAFDVSLFHRAEKSVK
jgi:hypothetical protein